MTEFAEALLVGPAPLDAPDDDTNYLSIHPPFGLVPASTTGAGTVQEDLALSGTVPTFKPQQVIENTIVSVRAAYPRSVENGLSGASNFDFQLYVNDVEVLSSGIFSLLQSGFDEPGANGNYLTAEESVDLGLTPAEMRTLLETPGALSIRARFVKDSGGSTKEVRVTYMAVSVGFSWPSVIAPLRQFPRSDGLVGTGGARALAANTRQASIRQGWNGTTY